MARAGLTVAGIPIRFTASWLLVVAYMIWTLSTGYFPSAYPEWPRTLHWALGVAAAFLLFACIVLHELGHSLVAKRHRIPVTQVTLFFFGGVSQLAGVPRRPVEELRIAVAGPAVSVALGFLCLTAASHLALPRFSLGLLEYLGLINIGLACFNMLPAFPLDGGRALRAVLWAVLRNHRQATRWAGALGSVFGLGLMAFGVWLIIRDRALSAGLWQVLLGAFLRNAARRESEGEAR